MYSDIKDNLNSILSGLCETNITITVILEGTVLIIKANELHYFSNLFG